MIRCTCFVLFMFITTIYSQRDDYEISRRFDLPRNLNQDKDPKNRKYFWMAQDSLNQYESNNDMTIHYMVYKINKVREELLNGTITHIDFTILPAFCQKISKLPKCFNNPAYIIECHSELWDQSWINRRQITVDCGQGKDN